MRRALLVLALALSAPASASASSGGLFPTHGGVGATAAGYPSTYVTVPAGRRSVVEEINKADNSVSRWRLLPGDYAVPLVATDGATTGLAANGQSLVLAENPRTYPPEHTRLLVLDPATFKILDRVSLPGFSSVDALSPDGRWVYFVHYRHGDPLDYEVRAYDLARDRLDPKPIVDPREPDEKMTGTPVTRLMSADNRWAYTLYSADEPFVHALDTVNKTAVCIDLDGLDGTDLGSAKLTLDGPTLHVGGLATIDTRTYKASEAPIATPTPRATPTPAPVKHDESNSPWPFAAIGLVALGLVALIVRRRRSVHDVVDLQVTVDHPDEQPALRE